MEKILVGRDEPIDSVIERIKTFEDNSVTLVIPKNAAIKDSAINFSVLRREAALARKMVVVESVDDDVLALCRVNQLESHHPLFQGGPAGRSFSDIVLPSAPKNVAETVSREKKNGKKSQKAKEKEVKEIKAEETYKSVPSSVEVAPKETLKTPEIQAIKSPPRITPGITVRVSSPPPKRWRLKRIVVILGGIVILLVSAGWVVAKFFSHVDVTITFKKTPWKYTNSFTADKKLTKVDPDHNSMPAEIFTQSKNIIQVFPASGRGYVAQKAAGKMTIYNAYSSKPQPLVATTRFATPDGKIFRIDDAVVVPGAEIKDGKIIPSSVEVAVTADQAGPVYNIGPVSKLTIPGFRGSPKYDGFYGTIGEPVSGGFVGDKSFPTDQDVTSAKSKVTEILLTALKTRILNKLPEDFKILDTASQSAITKITVNKNTDDKGNFSVFGEAELRAIGFKEADPKSILLTAIAKDYPQQSFRSLNLNYSKINADFDKGILTFSLDAQGVLVTAFDAARFKSNILGKGIAEVKGSVSHLAGLDRAKVSFWPAWLRTIPVTPGKVKVIVE